MAMDTSFTFGLGQDETLRLPQGVPVVVRVHRGTVLVTQAGDLDDHVLEPGTELVLRGGGLAVAWAFTPARLSVLALHEAEQLAA